MATLSELQARLEELKENRAAGVLRHRFGQREVWFRPDAEIAAIIADLERQIEAAQGRQPIKTIRIYSSKGV